MCFAARGRERGRANSHALALHRMSQQAAKSSSHRLPRRTVNRAVVIAAAGIERDSAASLIEKILGDQTVGGNLVRLV